MALYCFPSVELVHHRRQCGRVLGGAEFQSLQLFCSDLEQEECAYNNNTFKHYLHTVAQAKCIGILKFQLFSKQCYTQQLAQLNPHVCTN